MLKLKKGINNDSSIKIGSNNNFGGDSAIGENAKIIKNVQIFKDNSVTYDVDMENNTILEKVSVVVINKYGEKKTTFAGAISLISGLFSIFVGIDSFIGKNHVLSWLPDWIPTLPQKFSIYFLVVGLILFLCGVFLISLVRYKHDSS